MQQYLPFTVLKPPVIAFFSISLVATVLTVYGIETGMMTPTIIPLYVVATVLTVYGIETDFVSSSMDDNSILLQQYLPFTVLKLYKTLKTERFRYVALQQYLPFTVLKPLRIIPVATTAVASCNSTYRLRY